MAYNGGMTRSVEFLETSIFTRRVIELLSDEEYRRLQADLAQQPEAGVVIPGTGGLRKLRWGLKGRGKRGGARLIYYWTAQRQTILMLFVFAMNERADLTPAQCRILEREVRAYKGKG
jgi:mRNA-degrading endonuclease RelE of RelBE toxin-antitoxin system